MISYLSIFKTRFISQMQYRAAAMAGLYTQLFWGLIRVMILKAFYQGVTGPIPLALNETISYIWLSQALLRLVPWHVDRDLEKIFVDGNVAYELVRPVNLFVAWFFRILALRVAPVLLTGVPLLLIAKLF